MTDEYLDDGQEYYETVEREEEYEQDQRDDVAFLYIINRRIRDKRRRKQLLLTYFGEEYDRENFGDC